VAFDDENQDPALDTRIAIIGASGKFPGADDLDQFWANLRDGRESIRELSDQELREAGTSLRDLHDPQFVRRAGYLDGVAAFDAQFFGIAPRDAAVMDPQHRIFLELAWQALEDAGYDAERCAGPLAIYAGSGLSLYCARNLMHNKKLLDSMGEFAVRHTANDRNFLATLAAYKLNATGPSMNVQTACSSALVAVHLAVQSLLNGECDVALAGAVALHFPQQGYVYREGEILSVDGHCRAFDASSTGTVYGSGAGIVVLKRLQDALADRDDIRAVLLASAINNDGSDKVGFMAPSVSGQAGAIAQALELSGVSVESISYVEAHGTGTRIGDPIELAALSEAFGARTKRRGFCGIGSVKTNIGHLGEAAGIAGLLKVVLAMRAGLLPRSLHFQQPNPELGLPESPFQVVTETRAWPGAPGAPRRAGVTALGAGGTNAHVILEQAPSLAAAAPASRAEQLLVFSAKSEAALQAAARNLATHLRGRPEQALPDVAYTLQSGRKAFEQRGFVVAGDHAGAVRALEGSWTRGEARGAAPRLVFLFPGGGAQYPGMGAELYQREPVFKAALDECAALLQSAHGVDLRQLLYAGAAQDEAAQKRLQEPTAALPALFSTAYAMARQLLSWGLEPSAMIGHSLGEYVAACLCGVFSLPDALAMVMERGRLMQSVGKGGMLAVALPAEQLRPRLGGGLGLAAINGPAQCVVTGPHAELDSLHDVLVAQDIDVARLRFGMAAHSSMLDPVLDGFERFCQRVKFSPPTRRFISNLTGTWADGQVSTPRYWVRHLRETVRFADGVATLLSEGETVFVEVGPGRALTSLVRQQPRRPAATVTTLRHVDEAVSDVSYLLGAAGQLFVAGVQLDWDKGLHGGTPRRRVQLPAYAFQRQNHWIEPDPETGRQAPLQRQASIDDWFYTPSWQRSPRYVSEAQRSAPRQWLVFADQVGLSDQLHSRLSGRVIWVRRGLAFSRKDATVFEVCPSRAVDFEALLGALDFDRNTPVDIVYLWPVTPRRSRLYAAEYTDLEERCFLGVFCLLQALFDLDWTVRLSVVGNHLLQVDNEHVEPAKSLALGPVRVGPRESTRLQARCIDLEYDPVWSRLRSGPVSALLDELVGSTWDGTVALRATGRYTQTLSPVALPAAEQTRWPLREGGVYVVTGGLSGLGLEVARHMASQERVTLVLVGRQGLPARLLWPGLLAEPGTDPGLAARIRAVQRLESLGASVLAAAADVADPQQATALVERVREQYGRIDGVVHSAAVIDDGPIQAKLPSDALKVLAAKARGALNLAAALDPLELEFFVLFSSTSSFLGLEGQVDYTAANAVLDALAQELWRSGFRRVHAINWGAWRDVGMAALAAGLLHAPTPGTGVTLGAEPYPNGFFRQAWTEGTTRFLHAPLRVAEQWLLSEHRVHGGAALIPGTGYLDLIGEAARRDLGWDGFELRDVVFAHPLTVADDAEASITLRLAAGEAREFAFYSTNPAEPHVTGVLTQLTGQPLAPLALDALAAACPRPAALRDRQIPQPFVALGPRWSNIRALWLGKGEALAELELDARFAADLERAVLHPALLDMATGGAQHLVDGFDPEREFFVPFAYQRLRCHRPLGGHVFSHVRFRGRGAGDTVSFDVTITGPEGDVRARIDGFTMKAVPLGQFAAQAPTQQLPQPAQAGHPEPPSSSDTGPGTPTGQALLEIVLQGIRVEEGMEVLGRVLNHRAGPQLVASPIRLPDWVQRVDQLARAAEAQTDEVQGVKRSGQLVLPANAVEAKLLELWREVLGAAEVSVTDDFFDLGGQSLVAARMFVRIRKAFGVSLPMSTLFEAPTIRQLARVIDPDAGLDETVQVERAAQAERASQLPASGGWNPLVPIQPRGQLPAFFCAPGMGGNPLGQRFLSERLGKEQPFYGLQARGVDGALEPHDSVEAIAAEYLEAVRRVQPVGPYHLGGFSGGGVVAFEMAQQLLAAGESVGLLALLDAYHPQLPRSGPVYRLRAHAARMRAQGMEHALDVVRWRVESGLLRSPLAKHLRGNDPSLVARSEADDRALTQKMMNAWMAAERRYRPRPYPGSAVLFRVPWDLVHGRTDAEPDPENGWSPLILGGLQVVTVPGSHDSLLLEPNVQTLARDLAAALAASRAE
jgi:acyl transferase domain-containing protein/thioesterase domain-containing protein